MTKETNKNKKQTPGHISFSLLNAVVHSRTSTWIYWTTKTRFRMVVVVLLHSDTAAAYIHIFLLCFCFVLVFFLEKGWTQAPTAWQTVGEKIRIENRTDYWRIHRGTFLSWGRGEGTTRLIFFSLFAAYFFSPHSSNLQQTLTSL